MQAGPSFVRYLMAPESQTTVERIQARAVDLQVRLGLPAEPIIHHIPGAVAIDVARPRPRTVPLEEVLQRAGAPSRQQGLEIPLGVRIDGGIHIVDLADSATPHLLVAGATGSGKSTLLLAMAAAMATWYPPQQVQLLLIDPKQVTFGPLAGSPYLWRAPALDPAEATRALDELIREMQDRYRRLTEAGVQGIDEWARRAGAEVARIVCMVDEFASLVLTSRRDREAFEERIRELANKGRAAGIHLVLATQRPDSTVISGSIKANFAARVALKVGDRTSSTVVLDQPGAQALAGRGELFFSSGSGELLRLQAPHVTPEQARSRLRVPSPVLPHDGLKPGG